MRRGKPRKNALNKFSVMLNNVRGYRTKEVMIKRIIEEEEPVMIALVETKLNGKIDIPVYIVSQVDRDSEGGGVLLAYKRSLKRIVVCTNEVKLNQAEMGWHMLDNGKIRLKIGVIYMPQESRTSLQKLQEIYDVMEEEIADARQKGDRILILGDLNCKIGEVIQGNKAEITMGGRLLLKLIKKYKMSVLNGERYC